MKTKTEQITKTYEVLEITFQNGYTPHKFNLNIWGHTFIEHGIRLSRLEEIQTTNSTHNRETIIFFPFSAIMKCVCIKEDNRYLD